MKCLHCGLPTKFLSSTRGYRKYCSVRCLNQSKPLRVGFIEKATLARKQAGYKPLTSQEVARRGIQMRINSQVGREKACAKRRTPESRKLASQKQAQRKPCKNLATINGIRCESRVEIAFVNDCIAKKLNVRRFEFEGAKSVQLDDQWVLPDFTIDEVVVEVKDFHLWFLKEYRGGFKKYWALLNWCKERELIYLFWFKQARFCCIEEALRLCAKVYANSTYYKGSV